MEELVFVNGEFFSSDQARISVFDRSILFSDAVYEVVGVLDGKLLDFHPHMRRLQRSLARLSIKYNLDADYILAQARQLISRARLQDGLIYLQVTRGAAERDFVIAEDLKPNIFMFVMHKARHVLLQEKQLKLRSQLDRRWELCDIKTTQLLAASMAKSKAKIEGADDAVLVRDGYITEASSANFYIIDTHGCIITRGLDGSILPGITRDRLLKLARENNIKVEERPIKLEEAYRASESFISSATSFVHAVVEIDGHKIGDGGFGQISRMLRQLYLADVERI